MSKELIARIEEQWAMLDPVDPLRVVLDDVLEALAAPQSEQGGWLQDGSLLYRLTDERKPQNRDEINVTMAGRMRTTEAREKLASELLTMLAAAPLPAQPATVQQQVATVIEELEHDGQGFCAKVRWLYNPVPVGEMLSWEQPK